MVSPVLDYDLPIYGNTLNLTELARLERLQYKAFKLELYTLPVRKNFI